MPVDDAQRRGRAHFLRKRREKVLPADVGLPGGHRRRTPGLRREEVAVLAGVSPTWYTYLEQARDVSPSPEVLDNLATVLGLSTYERNYLYNVSREESAAEPDSYFRSELRLPLQDLISSVGPVPAYICSQFGDLLAWNEAATEWLDDFGRFEEERRNTLLWMLTAEVARERFVNWEVQARHLIARFRADVATTQDSPRVAALVRELSERSPVFRRWWDEHEVAGPDCTAYPMRHPRYGAVPVRTLELLYQDASACVKMVIHMPTDGLPAEPGTG